MRNRVCGCGHVEQAHEHFRPGRDCGVCGAQLCARFRAARPHVLRWRRPGPGPRAVERLAPAPQPPDMSAGAKQGGGVPDGDGPDARPLAG